MRLFLWILMAIMFTQGKGVYCPHYCRCMVLSGLRYVQCVGRGLISVELDVPRTVQWLQLSNNSIYELRDYIFEELGLEHIVELNLDNNAIQSIGLNAFAGLKVLQYVDLSGNHLYNLPVGVFENNPSLTYLNFHGNPLRYFRSTFLMSNSLSVLDISSCRLNFLPTIAFKHLPAISKINISMNHIEMLSVDTFENLTRLTELDYSQNKLQCDSLTKEMEAWLDNKRIHTTGSPCQIGTEPPRSNGHQFERMMMFEPVAQGEFDDYANMPCECVCDNKDQANESTTVPEDNTTEDKKKKVQINYNPVFLLLAFINGIIVGVAFTLSVWVCYRWMKAKYRNTEPVYNVIDNNDPPPAYSELF